MPQNHPRSCSHALSQLGDRDGGRWQLAISPARVSKPRTDSELRMEVQLLPNVLHTPPNFCQYANGACDQDFETVTAAKATFLYASDPENIAGTIEGAITSLQRREGKSRWISWKDLR